MRLMGLSPVTWRVERTGDGETVTTGKFIEPVVIGSFGSVLVLVGSLQHNSPFTSKIPGSWYLGVPSTPLPGNSLVEFLSRWLVYVGVALICYVWVKVIRLVRQGRAISPRALWVAFWAWVIPLMIAGPLFSRDVYSYAAQGEMVATGIDPYSYGPIALGKDPFLATVDPFWGRAKAPYGPFFLWIDGLIVKVVGHNPLTTVLGLRILALAGAVLAAKYAPRIAASLGKSPNLAFVLVALNPLVLFHLISSGHNDSIMIGLMIAAIAYYLEGKPILAIILAALGAAVKAPAIVAIGFIGYNWTGATRFSKRVRGAVIAIVITAAVFVALKYISGLGWGWLLALSTPGAVVNSVAPTAALAEIADAISGLLGLGIHFSTWVAVFRLVGLLAAGLIGAGLLLTSERRNIVRFIGITLVAVVVLGPVIQPWYLAWGLVVLACAPGKLTTWGTVVISIGAIVLGIPGGPSIVSWILYFTLALVVLLIVATKVPKIPPSIRQVGNRIIDDAVYRVVHAVGLYRDADSN